MQSRPSRTPELVSVVVPTFNDDKARLLKTLDSIVLQDYRPLDILVVDDGSLAPFAALTRQEFIDRHRALTSDCAIRFISAENHVGLASVKNTGIRLAHGSHVSFLDCGDWWHPEKLSEQMRCFKSAPASCGLVYCGIKIVEVTPATQRELYEVRPLVRGDNLQPLLLVNNRITGSNSTVLIKREVFDVVGCFYDAEEIPEDIDLWSRIAARFSIDFSDRILSYIEKRPLSMSSDPEKKSVTYLRYYQMRRPEIEKFGLWGRAMSQYYSVIGRKLFLRKKYARGLHFFVLAARHEVNVRLISRLAISVAEGVFGAYGLTKHLYSLQHYFSKPRDGRISSIRGR